MFVYDNLGSIVAGAFTAGIAAHFLRRWRERRFYVDFRDAYEASVRRVHETNCAPAAVVRCKELEREFMRLSFPPWFWGFGRWVWAVVKVCAAVAVVALVARGVVGRVEGSSPRSSRRSAPASMGRCGPDGGADLPRRHRPGSWAPVMSVNLVPSDVGGDSGSPVGASESTHRVGRRGVDRKLAGSRWLDSLPRPHAG